MTDNNRFAFAKRYLENPHNRYNIGTYKERSQHLLLKYFYEPDDCYHEIKVEGFVADVYNKEGITEIQTAGFRALHDKLAAFLYICPVTVVYPVHHRKRTMWIDTQTGDSKIGRYVTNPRKKYSVLSELLAIVDYFGEPGLSVQLVSMNVTDHKLLDGYGKTKKLRATKIDTVPDELLDITILQNADDIRELLPFEAETVVTGAEISKALGLRKISLWKAIKFLTICEVLIPIGKKGNAILYKITSKNID